jgi:flagellar basal body-associated protein FliL
MHKTLLFISLMVLITFIPFVVIILVVMMMKAWMSRKGRDSSPDGAPGPTPDER